MCLEKTLDAARTVNAQLQLVDRAVGTVASPRCQAISHQRFAASSPAHSAFLPPHPSPPPDHQFARRILPYLNTQRTATTFTMAINPQM